MNSVDVPQAVAADLRHQTHSGDDHRSESIPRLLISVTEAAGVLGVSRSYAYELVNAGFLSSIRLGRRVLVPISALEDLIARGQDES